MFVAVWFVQASKPGFYIRVVHSIWPRLRKRNFKLRKRREDVIPGKLYVSNTFFAKVKKKSMKGFEANDCKKNRTKVNFYNHVAATTPWRQVFTLKDLALRWSHCTCALRHFWTFLLSVAVAICYDSLLMHRTIPQSPWVRACIPSYSVGSL